MDLASFYRRMTYDMDGLRILPNRYDQIGADCLSEKQFIRYYKRPRLTPEQKKEQIQRERLNDIEETLRNLQILKEIRDGLLLVPRPKPCLMPPDLDPKIRFEEPTHAHKESQARMAARGEKGRKYTC